MSEMSRNIWSVYVLRTRKFWRDQLGDEIKVEQIRQREKIVTQD
jgi:hypothetical protein